MDIVLFGIQGSGKGTLGKYAAEKYDFEVFETGSELRKLSKEESDLAKKVRSIMEAGHLVPNEVVMDIIENFFQKLPTGKKVLFDGIPRKEDQAKTFNALMKKLNRDFKGILIDVPEETALNRLMNRRICDVCKTVYPASYTQNICEKDQSPLTKRSDDNPESIKNRIHAFFTETNPVIEQYKAENKIITMNGNLEIEEAKQEIEKIIEAHHLA